MTYPAIKRVDMNNARRVRDLRNEPMIAIEVATHSSSGSVVGCHIIPPPAGGLTSTDKVGSPVSDAVKYSIDWRNAKELPAELPWGCLPWERFDLQLRPVRIEVQLSQLPAIAARARTQRHRDLYAAARVAAAQQTLLWAQDGENRKKLERLTPEKLREHLYMHVNARPEHEFPRLGAREGIPPLDMLAVVDQRTGESIPYEDYARLTPEQQRKYWGEAPNLPENQSDRATDRQAAAIAEAIGRVLDRQDKSHAKR